MTGRPSCCQMQLVQIWIMRTVVRMRESLSTSQLASVQVIHITDACYHAQQTKLINTASKHHGEIFDYRLLLAGQNTQQNKQDFVMY